jgi:hypothetical protein
VFPLMYELNFYIFRRNLVFKGLSIFLESSSLPASLNKFLINVCKFISACEVYGTGGYLEVLFFVTLQL